MKLSHVVIFVVITAAIALTVFGVLINSSTSVRRLGPSEAAERFAALRDSLGGQEPWVFRDASGTLQRRPPDPGAKPDRASRLYVAAYRTGAEVLAEADIPFWFIRMKRPAVQFTLRHTGIDWTAMGISNRELESHGAGLVFEEARENGDRVLVWTR